MAHQKEEKIGELVEPQQETLFPVQLVLLKLLV
jgi:hypothetical protein